MLFDSTFIVILLKFSLSQMQSFKDYKTNLRIIFKDSYKYHCKFWCEFQFGSWTFNWTTNSS